MPDDGTIQIGNEFAVVHIRKIETHNGERLEIEAPRLGYRIELDPLELESLTWQPKETFSQFLEAPYGPGRASNDGIEKLLEPETW